MSAIDTTSLLAHGIHYAIVGGGVVGLGLLLLPHLGPTGGRAAAASTRGRAGTPRDDHADRVAQLRASLSGSTAASGSTTASVQTAAPARTVLAAPAETRPGTPPPLRALALPVALVSSAAAAGVHAAAGPAHFEEGLLLGSFFLGAALAQLLWAGAALLAPSRRLLLAGAVGNLAVVALWITTRTIGLPGGLLDGPEAVGTWDLAATGWELVTAVLCLALLSRRSPLHLASSPPWHPAARAWLVGALGALVLMTVLSGGAA